MNVVRERVVGDVVAYVARTDFRRLWFCST